VLHAVLTAVVALLQFGYRVFRGVGVAARQSRGSSRRSVARCQRLDERGPAPRAPQPALGLARLRLCSPVRFPALVLAIGGESETLADRFRAEVAITARRVPLNACLGIGDGSVHSEGELGANPARNVVNPAIVHA
jgi:hypothetical protein